MKINRRVQDMIFCWLKILNSYNGLLTFLTSVILAVITGYYAFLTKKQVNNATFVINNELEQKVSVKSNLGFLINAEINLNLPFFVWYCYYYSKGVDLDIVKYRNFIVNNVKNQEWKMASVEAAKLFSKDVMEELVGHYSSLSTILNCSQETFSNTDFYTFSKVQLVSSFKCLKLLETELGRTLRIKKLFNVDGKTIVVNDDGEISFQ